MGLVRAATPGAELGGQRPRGGAGAPQAVGRRRGLTWLWKSMCGTWQRTAASASCRHPLRSASWKRHSPRERSRPVHCTPLMWMGPRPEAEGGLALPAPCLPWSREVAPPSFPQSGRSLREWGCLWQEQPGSPVPVQARAAGTSRDAPSTHQIRGFPYHASSSPVESQVPVVPPASPWPIWAPARACFAVP